MTTRNFRVNNGLEVGDIVISASANTITGGATAAPSADGQFANKKYVDDQIDLATFIISGSTNVTAAAASVITTVEGIAEMTVTRGNTRIHGNLTVDGNETIMNTTTLSVEDNIIELNRNVSSNVGIPALSGIKVNRGESSTATEQDPYWCWDNGFEDDGTTIFGNSGGAWTAFKRPQGGTATPEAGDLVDIRANVIHAISTSAQYADVAERFSADAPMAEGAVVMLGGSQEITEVESELSDDVFGVISRKPAYAMNAGAGNDDSHPYVAMTGRTPVRVTGPVSKGQRLVASTVKGTARAVTDSDTISPFHVIGRALENKYDDAIGLVNCAVRTNN
tara:strand:- start:716 stop:1723 length:1008 start_codon:yes stop_codon:yes gene_type:complete